MTSSEIDPALSQTQKIVARAAVGARKKAGMIMWKHKRKEYFVQMLEDKRGAAQAA
jgi:hypothetical protein